MISRTDKILILIAVLVLIGLTFEVIYFYYNWPKGDEIIVKQEVIVKEKQPLEKKEEPAIEEPVLPEHVDLSVPFTSQAPFGDWSYPFNHTCEEAAVLMVHYYLSAKTSVDPGSVRNDLLDMVAYELKTYGFHEDTSAEQTAQFVRDYYGYQAKVMYDISSEDIKKELAKGNPIVIPSAGRMLGNPYFTGAGPLYHMLTIKGYNSNGFITNDPGTKRGADYFYSYDVLMGSIHDWNNGDVNNGKSAIIIIEK